jgi:hypothetical protein
VADDPWIVIDFDFDFFHAAVIAAVVNINIDKYAIDWPEPLTLIEMLMM